MFWTNDPVADAERYAAEQEQKDGLRPICDGCSERIYDDEYYDIYDDIYCTDCLNKRFLKEVTV